MESWNLLLEVVVLLAGCLILGAICVWLKQSPIVGYLLAGMILGGPGSLRLVKSEHDIEAIAELGVALLLFTLGLEFSFKRLLGLGTRSLLSGVVQVAATTLLGMGVALLFGLSAKEAAAIGAIVSLSSTAVVLRVLIDLRDIDTLHARSSVAILLVQDMAVVPLAILMTILAQGGTPNEVLLMLGKIIGLAAILILSLYLLLNKLAVPLLQSFNSDQNRELAVVLAIVLGLGATYAAHAMGLSPSLGAFIAGMFLGSSAFAVQLRADVASLRAVLLTLFFGAVGLVADPWWIAQHLGLVLAVAALILALKGVVVWSILRMAGQPNSVALATGMCLAQVGEFAFVLASSGRQGEVISRDLHLLLVSSTIITMFVTPYIVAWAPAAANWLDRRRFTRQKSDESIHLHSGQADVVIIGFGPSGQAVGRSLQGKNYKVLVLDINPQLAALAESFGFEGQIGDSTQFEILEHAGVSSARMIVITIPALSATRKALQCVKQIAPHAHLVVRARYQRDISDLEQAGATAVFGDEEQVGYRLSNYVNLRLALEEEDQTEASPVQDVSA